MHALATLRSQVAGADVSSVTLDLSSLASIRAAVDELPATIDLLINNGGLTDPPRRRETTDDGLERTVATNAYGPFALTALALPAAHRLRPGRLARQPQHPPRQGRPRRPRAAQSQVRPVPRLRDEQAPRPRVRIRTATTSGCRGIRHPVAAGAPRIRPERPELPAGRDHRPRVTRTAPRRAAAHPDDARQGSRRVARAAGGDRPSAKGGEFYGPSRSVTGRPVLTKPVAQSASAEFGAAAWAAAEAATGVEFNP